MLSVEYNNDNKTKVAGIYIYCNKIFINNFMCGYLINI